VAAARIGLKSSKQVLKSGRRAVVKSSFFRTVAVFKQKEFVVQ
jgi:hypothetical protein